MTRPTHAMHDKRLEALTVWLDIQLPAEQWRSTPIQNDASFRRYFRINTEAQSWIAMDAPPDKIRLQPFLGIATQLKTLALNVPDIYQHDLTQGFALLSDLGSKSFLTVLTPQTADALYTDAISALVHMQTNASTRTLPAYNTALLSLELSLFNDWFLQKHLHIQLNTAQHAILEEACTQLLQNAITQPQVFVHRDFHSRNLMLTPDNNPGILDFQDAVAGPITYDAVSLLRDAYINWPTEKIYEWLNLYHTKLQTAGILNIPQPQFRRWFDLMGLQRHLKIVGIFCRLNYRDNKPGYLKDIPRTYDYIREVCTYYPELQPLRKLLDSLNIHKALQIPT